jgi:hypothetical protein
MTLHFVRGKDAQDIPLKLLQHYLFIGFYEIQHHGGFCIISHVPPPCRVVACRRLAGNHAGL